MFGHSNSGRVRMKPPASNWLLAPMPVPLNSHSAPMAGWFHHSSDGYSETGWVQAYCRYSSRWSWRFSPTPGRSWTTGMSRLCRSLAGPTPERWRICGEAMAPLHSRTSLRARTSTATSLVLVIALLDSTRVFRLARAVAMNVVVQDFVEAARLRGEGTVWLVTREILP